jgi:hypothetical protein
VERLRALGFDITQQEQTTLAEDRTNKSSILQGELREKLSSLYDNLNDEDVKKLKGEFSIRYWIVPVEKSSNLPVVFKNKKFKILEVR